MAGQREALITRQCADWQNRCPCARRERDFEYTQNLSIEGDNLEGAQACAGDLSGQGQMIYIDPP